MAGWPLRQVLLLAASMSATCLHVGNIAKYELAAGAWRSGGFQGGETRSLAGAAPLRSRARVLLLRGGNEMGEGHEQHEQHEHANECGSPPVGTPPLEEYGKEYIEEEDSPKNDISDRIYKLLDEAKRRGKAAMAGRAGSEDEAKRLAEETVIRASSHDQHQRSSPQPKVVGGNVWFKNFAAGFCGTTASFLVHAVVYYLGAAVLELVEAGSNTRVSAAPLALFGIMTGCILGGYVMFLFSPPNPGPVALGCATVHVILQLINPQKSARMAPSWFQLAAFLTPITTFLAFGSEEMVTAVEALKASLKSMLA